MASPVGQRIFVAHLELSYGLGRRVTLEEFGRLIAKQMGRRSPFTATAVSRWESGLQAPTSAIIEAIAELTKTDPGWISHGERSAAPAPRSDVAHGDGLAVWPMPSKAFTPARQTSIPRQAVRGKKRNG